MGNAGAHSKHLTLLKKGDAMNIEDRSVPLTGFGRTLPQRPAGCLHAGQRSRMPRCDFTSGKVTPWRPSFHTHQMKQLVSNHFDEFVNKQTSPPFGRT